MAAIALVAATAAGAASAGGAADPGVTPETILIGGTAHLTGESSADGALARGAGAYLRYVNAHGGVGGRAIVYRFADDGSDPVRTVQVVRRLVRRDGVFAIFNIPGTLGNLAVRDFLNEEEVPHLFAASGHTAWGSGSRRYPYTVGYGPSHLAEGSAYGRNIARRTPTARIAVLFQEDEDGRGLLTGLRRGLGRQAGRIVRALPLDPAGTEVGPQVTELKGLGADTLIVFAPRKPAVQIVAHASRLGWRPLIYVGAAAADELAAPPKGAISATYVKDPADPSWAGDPGLKLYGQIMERHLPAADAGDDTHVAGMAAAFTLVTTLRLAGRNLTRQGVLKATANLNHANNPFLLPGIVVRAGPNDRFPIEQLQLRRWNGTRWVRFGGLVTAQ